MDQMQEVRRNRAALAASERVETLMLEGELGEEELTQLCEDLMHRLHRGIRQVVVDFADVSHLNYRGVRPLMARTEAFRRAGGDVKLSGLSPYLAAIFRAAGAHDTFELYPHMNDARAAFSLARAPFV
ncbi:STAS domain-containing protein [Corallococcus sp. ZKHCc1 1396]|uniref:STAS domain-containing protein n=1 Tax=Corallococcus soli TaxID=2710757 RepID=A0ABR9PPZ5_9BACT|nr:MULTISPECIES: STAS domain-containing protein [Corallococcus]MBE4749996.1 STAS domain-containing protein [Corallococcus soli]MCY1035781.1 STAS domain-containing protein [Corallococcus sp. BB11-1]